MNENPPLNGARWNISPFTVDGQPEPEPGQKPVVIPNAVSSGIFVRCKYLLCRAVTLTRKTEPANRTLSL